MIHYLGYYGTFNEPIGVGNSNPNYTLDVSGDINFTGNCIKMAYFSMAVVVVQEQLP